MKSRSLLTPLVLAAALAGCGGEKAARPAATSPATATTPAPTTPAVDGSLPGARAVGTCASAGDFWPTMTLARAGSTAWVACKEDLRVESLDGARLDLHGQAIAVRSAFGAVWALDDRGTLYRIAGGRIAKEIDLEAVKPYNLWAGAGSLWAVDDESGEVIRVDPRAGKVVSKIEVGDGPASIAFLGPYAYAINHRDRALVRIDTRTNHARKLATITAGEAPERLAVLRGSLWITGRGTDLLKVDPATGRVLKKIEIGGSGIDVIAAGGALWVPSRSEEVDQSGLPTMETLRRVTPNGRAKIVSTPTDRVDVHGLTADNQDVWLADNTTGVVYRVPLSG